MNRLSILTCLYMSQGGVYVSEDGTDDEVGAGELLFPKRGLRQYNSRRNFLILKFEKILKNFKSY